MPTSEERRGAVCGRTACTVRCGGGRKPGQSATPCGPGASRRPYRDPIATRYLHPRHSATTRGRRRWPVVLQCSARFVEDDSQACPRVHDRRPHRSCQCRAARLPTTSAAGGTANTNVRMTRSKPSCSIGTVSAPPRPRRKFIGAIERLSGRGVLTLISHTTSGRTSSSNCSYSTPSQTGTERLAARRQCQRAGRVDCGPLCGGSPGLRASNKLARFRSNRVGTTSTATIAGEGRTWSLSPSTTA